MPLKANGDAVRAFLFMVVCDIPAARMTCGFARETSAFGCPYCAGPPFPKRPKSAHNDWRMRDEEELSREPNTDARHRVQARAWAECKQPPISSAFSDVAIENQREKKFGDNGARWSVLLDLPYYDSIRCMPTDVMHSIMLGMCKHVLGTFTDHRSNKAQAAAARATARALAKHGAAPPGLPLEPEPVDEEESVDEDGVPMDMASSSEEEAPPGPSRRNQNKRARAQRCGSSARKKGSSAAAHAASEDTNSSSSDSSSHDSDDPNVSPEEEGDLDHQRSHQRGRSTAAAASSAASAAAAAPRAHIASEVAVLSKSDLEFLQLFMDHSKCPRDIGRILKRLSTLSKIKAIEWLNWFSIFAVPTIRELMRTGSGRAFKSRHPALTGQHLQIFILLQRIVLAVRSYTFDASRLSDLHADIIAALRQMELQFPKDVGCVSPNMHLALHLRSQILDYGPPSGFWCMPYERMNNSHPYILGFRPSFGI